MLAFIYKSKNKLNKVNKRFQIDMYLLIYITFK